MGSSLKRVTIFTVLVMVAAILFAVVYSNRDSIKKEKAAVSVSGGEGSFSPEESGADGKDQGTGPVGNDTRAFLEDETFFDPDKKPYSSIEKMEGKNLSLLMTSVQKDLRIRIVDNAGKPVSGEPFQVVLNGEKEYTDGDEDGVIYIEHLRAGQYEVALKEAEGYRVPDTAAAIEVKQSVEYTAIDDISLLIFTEDEVDPSTDDLEERSAEEDADRSEIKKLQAGKNGARVGIDVSKWNQEIDWDRVKSAGVEFAVIRVGYRGASTGKLIEDPYFESNMKGAARAGIPVGVYFFTQAVDPVEAVEEASMVVSLCSDYDITYPVFIDTEGAGGGGRADGLDTQARTGVCRAFCATVESAGYRGGVYGSRNWLNGMLDMDGLEDYIVWLAEYRDVPVYQGYYHMWQYTSGGSVDGIEGKVDLNLSYLKIDAGTDHGEDGEDADVSSDGTAAEKKDGVPEDGEEAEPEVIEPKAIGGTKNADR